MKERPILFSGPMVRAILQGCKTQTRRVINWQRISKASGCTRGRLAYSTTFKSWAVFDGNGEAHLCLVDCPYGQAGDRLWVKETHYLYGRWVKNGQTKTGRQRWKFKRLLSRVYFPGDDLDGIGPARKRTENGWHKRPSIFMPHWASRIMLEVASVRVERLNAITAADACAEGAAEILRRDLDDPLRAAAYARGIWDEKMGDVFAGAVDAYAALWESINGAGSWAANPWVWVVEFKPVEGSP